MAIDIIGDTYGQLTVVSLFSNVNYKKTFNCTCTCGKSTKVDMSSLRTGKTKSCGCLRFTRRPALTHGDAGSSLYKVYYSMRARCLNPDSSGYYKYGAKGVTICKEWVNSYEAFKEWAVDYKKGLSIDRINTKKGYSPSNCRWTTRSVQQTNKGKSIKNTSGYKGISKHSDKKTWVARITVNGTRTEVARGKCIESVRDDLIQYLKQNKLHEHLKAFMYD